MTSERGPRGAGDEVSWSAAEPRTEPLPAITGELLGPLEEPRVPELDDHTLAVLLAELEGEDVPAPALPRQPRPRDPREPPTRAPGAGVSPPVGPAASHGAGESPSGLGRDVAVEGCAGERAIPVRDTPIGRRLKSSPHGPVLSSEYGDYRPPIDPMEMDSTSLTGFSRRSHTKLGSLVFTLTFAAIFLAILIQALVSILTAGT